MRQKKHPPNLGNPAQCCPPVPSWSTSSLHLSESSYICFLIYIYIYAHIHTHTHTKCPLVFAVFSERDRKKYPFYPNEN